MQRHWWYGLMIIMMVLAIVHHDSLLGWRFWVMTCLFAVAARLVTDFQVDVIGIGTAWHPFRVQVELRVDSTFDYRRRIRSWNMANSDFDQVSI